MSLLERISFGFGSKTPLVLQNEATECGLACLVMVAGFHGHRTEISILRRSHPVSLKGATLGGLVKAASSIGLTSRPVRLELQDLRNLSLPCILHWDFNHFVVLKKVGRNYVKLLDPAIGMRSLSMEQVSSSFTGVALELWPGPNFKKRKKDPSIKLRNLIGPIEGMRRSISQVLLLALSLEVFSVLNPFFLQWVIDDAIVTLDRDLLATLAIGFGLVVLIQQMITALRSWLITYIGTSLNIQWRANTFSHLLSLPVEYFEKRSLGDVVSRFGAIEQIQHTLTSSFVEAVLDGVMTLITLLMMWVYSPILAGVSLAGMIIYGLSRWLWYRPLQSATEEQLIHAAKQQSHFLESMRGVRSIKLFQRQDVRQTTWLALLVDQINADLVTQKLQLFYRFLNGSVFGVEGIITIWLGAKLIISGNFSVGVLTAYLAYKLQFTTRVVALIDKYFDIKMLQVQGERLADIVLTEAEVTSTARLEGADIVLGTEIEVVDLCYRYSPMESLVLDHLNFKIRQGESVAIVGPSGGGKSTLINILLGIRTPSSGKILLGGRDITQVGIDAMRGITGVVMQDDVLFAGSIGDNISFFDPNADQDKITRCAFTAAILDDIMTMPMGFNTLVGDMGTVLSGGQKQRVLLARALYKEPKILVLDEATSSLDIVKEAEVNAAIKALSITRVIVAHRPETIASADRVITLSAGRVIDFACLENAADTPVLA
ncbi:peptidase domain-containing ABC transporter [Rugamonas sp. A1-17]|nr:peptidase domain-containing ABC transporter [Rugamonas sp. A1-17]